MSDYFAMGRSCELGEACGRRAARETQTNPIRQFACNELFITLLRSQIPRCYWESGFYGPIQ